MTEFRRDPLIGRWIVTGFAQGSEAKDLIHSLKPNPPSECPFCEGNERLTPPESYCLRKAGTLPNRPGWETRVVPNRGTDLSMGDLQKRGLGGIYDLQNASGVHETIVETPAHVTRFSELALPQMVKVLSTYQERQLEHRKHQPLKGTLIFRNQGKGSVSLFDHTHSHVISLPFVPRTIQDEIQGARRYFDLKARCIFCDMVREEQRMSQRIVYETSKHLSWNPFAARFPFETWVMPKEHRSEFLRADPASFEDLAHVLKTVLEKLEKNLGDVPVSFVIHTAPLRFENPEDAQAVELSYHWHIEILPHPLPVGGFEWGWDFFLSPPLPETCSKILRET